MSAEKLLEQLEKMRIDAKVLTKLRKQVAEHSQGSGKPAKAQAILKYLVQKSILSQADADRLLATSEPAGSATTAATSADDDILDLIEGVSPLTSPVPEKPAPPPAPAPAPSAPPSAATEKRNGDKDPHSSNKPKEKKSKPRRPEPDKKIAQAQTVFDPDGLEAFSAGGDLRQPDASFGFDDAATLEPSSKLPAFRGKKDKRDQWATKWLYIASMILGLLAIFGVVLAIATIGMGAEEKFKIAKESYDRQLYADSAKKFNEYYTAHPNHKEVGTAKTYEAISVIRSHYQNKNYDEAIRAADAMLPPVIADPLSKIDELRDDVAVVLPRSLYEISEEAKKAYQLADLRTQLERCKSLKKVIDNIEFIPTSQRNKPTTADYLTKIDDNIRAVQTQIDKEEKYQVGLTEIKKLGTELKTKEAFAIYRDLTRNFGDLAAREELRTAIREVSVKEQELVQAIELNLNPVQSARVTPILRSFVLSRPNGSPLENLKDEIFSFLADGSVYALRGNDGAILWRQFVGYQSEIQPQFLSPDQLLISDQQEFDLLAVDPATGQIIWRLEIGESFMTPSCNESMILVTTDTGKLIKLDPATGKVLQAAQLPQPASVPALISDQGASIYQPGSHSNLYVISKEDLTCKAVFYLGHEPGSIAVPPVVWSGYIVTAVNRGNGCDVWVFRPDTGGQSLNLVQVMNVFTNGIVTTPITRLSNWIMVSSEQGEIQLLELLTGEKDQAAPVTRFARELFENNGAKTFLLNEGNNIWIAGLEYSRIKLQRAQSRLTREKIVNAGDLFVAPLHSVDDYIFHVRRRKNSGMLSATLSDKITLEPVWRIDFGGVLPGPPVASGDSIAAVSNQGDLFRIDASSGINVQPTSIGSRTVESLRFRYAMPVSDGKLAALGISGQREMIFGTTDQGVLNTLASPAENAACRPLVLGNHLIIPTSDGPIVRIDPATGRMVGTPFMPPIAAGKKTVWYEPAMIGENQFAVASGSGDGSDSKLYLISAENQRALTESSSVTPPFPFKSQLASDGNLIFGAIESGTADQMFIVGAKDLTASQAVDLPGRVVAGPWIVGNGVLVKLDNEKLVMYDKSLAQQWDLSVPGDQLAGAPELAGDQLLVSFQNGHLIAVDPATGKVSRQLNLSQPIGSPLVRIGSSLYCSGLDGTVHEIDLARESGEN